MAEAKHVAFVDGIKHLAGVFEERRLSASRTEHRFTKTRRYELAEALAGLTAEHGGEDSATSDDVRFTGLAWEAKHLLLLTATPHMGKESPWFHLWRLLDPHTFGTPEALRRYSPEARERHFIRRTKEEMVDLDGNPLYRQRECSTFSFDLTRGEQALYLRTTAYLRCGGSRVSDNSLVARNEHRRPSGPGPRRSRARSDRGERRIPAPVPRAGRPGRRPR